jgi:protein O-GlcNAc transferase
MTLARDPARLAERRHSVRPRMATSPLCDAAAFARKVENAYRTVWQRGARRQVPPFLTAVVVVCATLPRR